MQKNNKIDCIEVWRSPTEQGQTNLLHQLQEEFPSRASAQRSPLSGVLDTPIGILLADRLS